MIRSLRDVLKLLFFPLSLLLLFMRCNHSSLSSGTVIDPSQLRVNVNVSRSADYDGRVSESIEAFIQDEKGKAVVNRQIQIKVNGKALRLNNGSSNYYGAYPYYQASDSTLQIGADTTCTVTVVLTDGTEYTLGTVQTQPVLTPIRFSPPATHSRRLPLALNWQDMEPHNWLISRWKRWQGESSSTELRISKINRTVDQWGNIQYEGGSTNEADYLAIPVGSGNGEFMVPTSYLEGPLKQFNTLDILIISEKSLEADQSFLKGSTIRCSRRGLFRIAITD